MRSRLLVLAFLLAAVAAADPARGAPRGITWQEDVAGAGARTIVELPSGELLVVRSDSGDDRVTIIAAASADGGRTWKDTGTVATDARGTDLGDCHLAMLPDGRVLCSFRRNHLHGPHRARPRYAIEVAESADSGRTWRPHSVVATSAPDTGPSPSRGLWSSYLLVKRDGTLQCYYDDEETPFHAGFPHHQWLTMRTWDAARAAWVDPVTVSRAHDERHLSRDGMPSVLELDAGRLLAVFESVQVRRPHANVVRMVTSDDGGRTWSWAKVERAVVYAPAKPGDFMALAPWVTRLSEGTLLCVFCTDEDRDVADVSGTPPHRMNLDIKSVTSADGGQTWDAAASTVYAGTHRNYLPGVLQLTAPSPDRGTILVPLLDFDGGHRLVRGRRE